MGSGPETYFSCYDIIELLGDFNPQSSEACLINNANNLSNLV